MKLAIKASLCYRILLGIVLLIGATTFFQYKDPPKPVYDVRHLSKWSYETISRPCDKEKAFARQFISYTENKILYWERFLDDEINYVQKDIQAFLKTIGKPPAVSGRGIIYSASSKALRMVSISVKFIRSYGCDIPIEIWHNDEFSEFDLMNIDELEGVVARNAAPFLKNQEVDHSSTSRFFAMKGAALLYTSFDEILFLDADNIPARDPTFLFETDAFKETGALFWKDYWMTKPNNPIYRILGLPCVDEHEFESGQMVIKKASKGAFEALSLAFYMQKHANIYYNFVHGDKDTFRFAWRHLKVPYHQLFPGIAGQRKSEESPVCGTTIIQFAPFWVESTMGNTPAHYSNRKVEIMFYHMNAIKDRPESGLDYVQYFRGDAMEDASAYYFTEGRVCLGLAAERNNTLEIIKLPRDFQTKYVEFFREWHR